METTEITGTRDNIRRSNFEHWLIAGAVERVIAFGTDLLFTLLLSMAINVFRQTPNLILDTLRIWVAVHWFYEAICLPVWGTTLGRRALGLRVFSPKRDGPPDFQQSVLRTVLFWLFLPLAGMSITPILHRRDRRGWHDQLAETLTLGTHKSIPSGLMQKIASGIVIFQTLAVFSFFAALLASNAIPQRIQSWTSAQTPHRQCDDARYFLNETSEALLALVISPAWAQCWDQKKFSLEPIAGSALYRFAEVARLLNAASTTSTISRQVAALHTAQEFNVVESKHLAPYKLFVQNILAAPDKTSRLKILRDELNTATHPIVVAALTDRIWAEELATHQVPSLSMPADAFPEWNRTQTCWIEALGLMPTSLCSDNPYSELVNELNSLETQNADGTEANNLAEGFSEVGYSEGHLLAQIWKARTSKNLALAKEVLAQFPETSPLYQFAQNWAQPDSN